MHYHRVALRWLARQADLNPPLGYPGGPCHVVERIVEEVENPRLEDKLVQDVESNKSLSNPEAAQIYDLEVERGSGGPFQKLVIGPHAQYRMDLRGINVPLVRSSLQNYSRRYNDLKSRGGKPFEEMTALLNRGEPIDWVDKRLGLTLVFAMLKPGTVKIVTTYWTGEPDPKARPGECQV